MNKILVFDMDGTIADLYKVDAWLDKVEHCDVTPFITAKPIYNMNVLIAVLTLLKTTGYKIVVTTWLPMDSTKDFDTAVRTAKLEWLDKYDFPYDEIHIVKYGTTKANCTRKYGQGQILIDDNPIVRKGWKLGNTIDAENENLIHALTHLLIEEWKSQG